MQDENLNWRVGYRSFVVFPAILYGGHRNPILEHGFFVEIFSFKNIQKEKSKLL
jgi:hypothetical protein